MKNQKRPFYIIGHNPNTIEEAKDYLDKGANALEPDIVYANGTFYVSHHDHFSYEHTPTVQAYLQDLRQLLVDQQYNLALIIWDIKNVDFDPNLFIRLVKQVFSGGLCDGVAMLMTNADDHGFVNKYKNIFPNVGVGVDESNISPKKLQSIFNKGGNKNISYADGITTILNKPGVFKNISEAIDCRNRDEANGFKIIYTWVLGRDVTMRKYLNIYIDGIMVDSGAVKQLKAMINSYPYLDFYEPAQNGHNPFINLSIPKYLLLIETKDKFLAGTDAQILFTLTGSSGLSLQSFPYDANVTGVLEKGSTCCMTLEGSDLGNITSLKVEMLTNGIGSSWLPERILVQSKLLQENVAFLFNNEGEEEWVSKKQASLQNSRLKYFEVEYFVDKKSRPRIYSI